MTVVSRRSMQPNVIDEVVALREQLDVFRRHNPEVLTRETTAARLLADPAIIAAYDVDPRKAPLTHHDARHAATAVVREYVKLTFGEDSEAQTEAERSQSWAAFTQGVVSSALEQAGVSASSPYVSRAHVRAAGLAALETIANFIHGEPDTQETTYQEGEQ